MQLGYIYVFEPQLKVMVIGGSPPFLSYLSGTINRMGGRISANVCAGRKAPPI